jgi:putative ABC transport system permease protein
MKSSDLVSTAFAAVRGSPMRSALTALGVVIGVASVIVMVALGQGAQKNIQDSIQSLGSNLLIIGPASSRSGGLNLGAGTGQALTTDDANAIKQEVINVQAVAPTLRGGTQAVAGGQNYATRLDGVDADYFAARDWPVAKGRAIDERDVRQARKVVVIGQTVATALFGDSDPVGQRLRASRTPFEVIGVLEAKGQSSFGQDQDDIMLAPITTAARRVAGRSQNQAINRVSQILVQAASEDDISQVEDDIRSLLRQRQKTPSGEADGFSLQNQASILATAQETTGVLTALLASIAGVSLLVGGIGIMNIMLVSVTERTREIGLRKALGASNGDILSQFTLEAIVLSVLGGAIGLAIGLLGAWGLTSAAKLPFLVSPLSAFIAVGVSALVGVVFGAYPAWRAARLDPIEALRRE